MTQGLIVVLSGPSGSGKDAVIVEWKKLDDRVTEVVTYTTRSPRDQEQDGRDYNFVTPDEFADLVARGMLLEWKEVHGKLYGSPTRNVDEAVLSRKIAVLKIDVQGAREVRKNRPTATSIFLMPPSVEVLEERLRTRGTETEEQVQTRLSNAKREMECAKEYQHVVVNDTLTECAKEINSIVRGYV